VTARRRASIGAFFSMSPPPAHPGRASKSPALSPPPAKPERGTPATLAARPGQHRGRRPIHRCNPAASELRQQQISGVNLTRMRPCGVHAATMMPKNAGNAANVASVKRPSNPSRTGQERPSGPVFGNISDITSNFLSHCNHCCLSSDYIRTIPLFARAGSDLHLGVLMTIL